MGKSVNLGNAWLEIDEDAQEQDDLQIQLDKHINLRV